MLHRLLFVLAAIFGIYTPSIASTVVAASCSQADVTTAIAGASSGDTVQTPGNCSPSWSSLTIPDTKGLTLDGRGTTTLGNALAIQVNSNSVTGSRITGFLFTNSGGANGDINVSGSAASAPYRIDHCTFTDATGAVFISVSGNGTGLIDHNTLTSCCAAEMIHNMGTGPSVQTGWTTDVTPGGSHMVYIEDNTFTDSTGAFSVKPIESYYGSRTVLRYNSFVNDVAIDQHGTAGMVGARWWEFYENTHYPTTHQTGWAAIRAGSGVYYNNHVSGSYSTGTPGVILFEEDSGYPACFQIGRGFDPVGGCTSSADNTEWLSPSYLWGNDSAIQSTISSGSSNVVAGRDMYVSVSQPASMMRCQANTDSGNTSSCSTTYSYSAFTYPYPLDPGGIPNPAGTVISYPIYFSGVTLSGVTFQ